jgi:exopolyphosphatase/guanosine-5'-triphosphate,3'-diphosphate pyrophosphatase
MLAAIDLGSNSFHMVVARLEHGLPVVVDRIREHVQLGAGLDDGKRITQDAWEIALACIARFGERVADLPADNVRAVGTNTLRKARNGRAFLEAARKALGHDIEVISGREEARLIYLGVAHAVDHARSQGRRLVVDIGGGSTELIVGERFEPVQRDSVQMGCISYRERYFADGTITRHAVDRAIVAARLEVRSLESQYKNLGWDVCIGASGTIKAIDEVLRTNRWTSRGITAQGLDRILDEIVAAGSVDELRLGGLSAERAPVFVPGVAILRGLFESFRLDEMVASTGALREGVLHDLVGRIQREDVRDRTIRIFQDRYSVDRGFAGRVERTALALFENVADAWSVDLGAGRRYLSWAARIHEIGLSISHSGHHRHGAYIVQNSDMPGFSRDDQEFLAALLLGHRRKLTAERLAAVLSPDRVPVAMQLCICLRLARRLNRVRRARRLPPFSLRVTPGDPTRLRLEIPQEWLAVHPLTRADLEDEGWLLQAAGYSLEVGSTGPARPSS